jgi:hypothetical protein
MTDATLKRAPFVKANPVRPPLLDGFQTVQWDSWERQWADRCPRAYRVRDDGRNPEHSALIDSWRGENVWLAGGSGSGKSWLAWQLLRRCYFNGKLVGSIDSSLVHRYARSHGEDREEIEQNLKGWRVVLVDDIDKMLERQDLPPLWDLVKQAADNLSLFITTSNLSFKEIRSWLMLDAMGEPLPCQSPKAAEISRIAVPLLRRLWEGNSYGELRVLQKRSSGEATA